MSVRLRRLHADDGPRVLAWRNSSEVSAHMYADHAIGEAEHARWLGLALAGGDRRYWLVELDGAPVGLANLARIDPGAGRCEWAFYLAERATRGRGVGSCVEYLVARYVFEALGLNKLWCEVLATNGAVLRMHEAFGFVREAVLREHVRKGEAFCDVVGLGLLRAEWPAAKARAEARLVAAGVDLTAAALEG